LADTIRDEIGAVPDLIKGSGGIFDVVVDDKLIYSKHQTGRFPDAFEVINQIKPVP
jgi:selenoprotein W-related protein